LVIPSKIAEWDHSRGRGLSGKLLRAVRPRYRTEEPRYFDSLFRSAFSLEAGAHVRSQRLIVLRTVVVIEVVTQAPSTQSDRVIAPRGNMTVTYTGVIGWILTKGSQAVNVLFPP